MHAETKQSLHQALYNGLLECQLQYKMNAATDLTVVADLIHWLTSKDPQNQFVSY